MQEKIENMKKEIKSIVDNIGRLLCHLYNTSNISLSEEVIDWITESFYEKYNSNDADIEHYRIPEKDDVIRELINYVNKNC